MRHGGSLGMSLEYHQDPRPGRLGSPSTQNGRRGEEESSEGLGRENR